MRSDWRDRVRGLATATLLAVATGYGLAGGSVDGSEPSVPDFSTGATPAQWWEKIKSEAAQRPPAAPELRTIQHGARLRVTHHPDSEGSLSTEDRKCLAHFLKFVENWVKSNTTKTLRLQVSAGARITQGNKIAKLADLKISDKVQIKFRTEGKCETATRNVIAIARGGSFQGAPTMIWLCGRIASLDAGAGRVTVAPLRPGLGDWKGLAFWQQAGDRATAYDTNVAKRLAVVQKWHKDAREGKTYPFTIDLATLVFLNGKEATLGELRLGDRVGVQYDAAGEEHDQPPHPYYVRASRRP